MELELADIFQVSTVTLLEDSKQKLDYVYKSSKSKFCMCNRCRRIISVVEDELCSRCNAVVNTPNKATLVN